MLSEDEREALNRYLLSHTLEALCARPEIEQTLVVSRDQAALALARQHGARTVLEDGAPELNLALRRATLVAKNFGASGVLILPADLPLITPQDLLPLLEKAQNPPVVVIAPDRHQDGTNALLVRPTGLIEYRFGPGSFEEHCRRARRAGAQLHICPQAALGLDVDVLEDLKLASKELASLNLNF